MTTGTPKPDWAPPTFRTAFPTTKTRIDTAPNRIESIGVRPSRGVEPSRISRPSRRRTRSRSLSREPTTEPDEDEEAEPASGPPSGRHAAIVLDEPAPAQTALRLALDDPYQAPAGYPVKADTTTGLYWMPGSGDYDAARAEIWFASEEFALTNGFVKG